MRDYIYTLLFLLAGLVGMAQTNEALPNDAKPLTNQLYLSTSDSSVWAADPFGGLAIKVGTWQKVDSLFKLGYTKTQVDSAIVSNLAGYVPTGRTINGKALTSNITLTPADIGAQSVITGAASTVVSSDLTPNRVVISNSQGKIINTSTVTSTELGYLSGTTSNIQAQLNGKADTTKTADPRQVSANLKGGTIIFYGDSYTAGSGASSISKRWTSLFAKQFGATEDNRGIAGATLSKRSPVDYMGAQNMVDRRTDIPTKTSSRKMLVFAFGLNDMGQTAAAYTTSNYKSDYATVLNYAISTRGWEPSQILIIAPYYIGSAGYSRYATITGNEAPTRQRHLQFIQATKEVAEQFGTMYWSPFFDQIRNDTTLIDTDGIHPTDAGHEYIFRSAATVFENTDYLPMTGGILRGSLGFQNGYSNVPAFIDFSPSASYMNIHAAPLVNSGNVGQSLSVSPRGTGVVTEGGSLNIRSQMVLWNEDFLANPTVQEGLVLRAAGTYYEIASVTAVTGGVARPIAISARGQNHNTTPSIFLATDGTVAINKKTSINPAYALDVNGDIAASDIDASGHVTSGSMTVTGATNLNGGLNVTGTAIVDGNVGANNLVTLPVSTHVLDFPSTAAGAASVLSVTVTGVSAGDVVALGLPSNLSDAGFYTYKAWCSAANTVKVQFLNLSSSPIDPGSATFKIKVFKL